VTDSRAVTICQAQRHACVIRPLAGLQDKRTAAEHVGNRLKYATGLELHRRADDIASNQPVKILKGTHNLRHRSGCVLVLRVLG